MVLPSPTLAPILARLRSYTNYSLTGVRAIRRSRNIGMGVLCGIAVHQLASAAFPTYVLATSHRGKAAGMMP